MFFIFFSICFKQFFLSSSTEPLKLEQFSFYNTEIQENLIFEDEIFLVSISNCYFHNMRNTVTSKGGSVYVLGSQINITIEKSFFLNSTANYGGAVFIEGCSTDISNSCMMMCTALNKDHAMFITSDLGSYTSNTFYRCQSNQNDTSSAIVTRIYQIASTKVTNTNYTQNQVGGQGPIVDVHQFEEIFFVNIIFENNEVLSKNILSAPYGIRLFFGDSIVVDNSVAYIFEFYSCGSRQVFNSYFIGNGGILFDNCDTAEMIITDCVFDFSIQIPYVEFRNCTKSNTSTYSIQSERCYVPIIETSKNFFSTTGGIITIVAICVVGLLIISGGIFILYIRVKRRKVNDNFYTDKFFTEYLNKTNLVQIDD